MLVPLGLQINSWGKGATPMSDTSPTYFTTKQGGDAFRKIHTSKPSDPSQKKKPMQVSEKLVSPVQYALVQTKERAQTPDTTGEVSLDVAAVSAGISKS